MSKIQISALQVLYGKLNNLSVLSYVTYSSSWIKPWLMDENANIIHTLYLSRDKSEKKEASVYHIRTCLVHSLDN